MAAGYPAIDTPPHPHMQKGHERSKRRHGRKERGVHRGKGEEKEEEAGEAMGAKGKPQVKSY